MFETSNYEVLNNCFLDNLEKGTIESELSEFDYLNEDFRKNNYLSRLILFFNNIFHFGYNCDTELFIVNNIDNFITNFEEMFKS